MAEKSKSVKGKTKSGFNYDINRGNLDNYELVELLGESQENPLSFPKAIVMFLGKEQTKKLKDHVRDENGIVPAGKMVKEVEEIMETQNETKNS